MNLVLFEKKEKKHTHIELFNLLYYCLYNNNDNEMNLFDLMIGMKLKLPEEYNSKENKLLN
jgi:hypothetical protein